MKSNTTLYILVLLSCYTFCCCTPEALDEKDLNNFIQDKTNGLFIQKDIGDVTIQTIYKPSDLVVSEELKRASTMQQRDSIRSNYRQYLYFKINMSIGKQDLETAFSGTSKMQSVQTYLNRKFGEHISLRQGNSQLKLLDFIYANMFGNTTMSSVLVVFENDIKDSGGDLRLTLNTGPLKKGIAKFSFESEKILKAPKLKL